MFVLSKPRYRIRYYILQPIREGRTVLSAIKFLFKATKNAMALLQVYVLLLKPFTGLEIAIEQSQVAIASTGLTVSLQRHNDVRYGL